MKLAFLGIKQSLDIFQIGGTENFTRRLSLELVKNGVKIDYILYGSDNISINEYNGITLRYVDSIKDVTHIIEREKYNHVVVIYILPQDRIELGLFRKRLGNSIKFHFIYFSWPDSWIKRQLYFQEARFLPYNGKLFCISKRQYELVSKWGKNAVHILPPVPNDYFLKPVEKPENEKIRVNFIGRIDPGKGIYDIIRIFDRLKGNDRIDCSIYGIHIPEHKESLNIHNYLKSQNLIKYYEVPRQKYSHEIEQATKNLLKNTDILILPYQKLSSTIDTPLTLLEAMASLSVVITKPLGNIPDIYGVSKFIIKSDHFVRDVIDLLNNLMVKDIIEERIRIYNRVNMLDFTSRSIVEKFFKELIPE